MPSIFDWSSTPASNTTIDGINCNTGMPVGNTDNLFRSLAAIIRATFNSGLQNFLNGTTPLGLGSGGTGATTAGAARSNLGLGALATVSTVPVANGGTGGTTQDEARNNLRALGITSLSLVAGGGYISFRFTDLPNDFKLQWGSGTATANTSSQTITYPTAFNSWSVPIVSGGAGTDSADENYAAVTSAGAASFTISTSYGSSHSFWWIAVGV